MKTPVVYICPMHPSHQASQPGRCPECGMALVKSKRKLSHSKHGQSTGKHEGHRPDSLAKKFWVSLAFTIPILLYSPLIEDLGMRSAANGPGAGLLSLVLGSIVFWYGGWIFLSGAGRELKGRAPGMMTLISLAILTAYVYSAVQTFRREAETLWWELTTLIVIMLLGHWLEMRAVQGAQGALKELSKLLPDQAEREKKGREGKIELETVGLDELAINDVVLVRPGAKVPADGEIIEGESEIEEAMVTGEAKPVRKKVGDGVIAGTINGDGSLRIKVTKIGDETFLAGVMRLVQEAQLSKSKLQLLSDRAAFYLTIIAVIAGLITFLVWLWLSDADFAFTRLVAVLVIACPHALGLAIPLVASISTTMAARNGFLVRKRLALEAAREIEMVLFDKTGTLTKGEYGVMKVWALGQTSRNEVLQWAASVDAKSEHPIAKAIVRKAAAERIELVPTEEFKALRGRGAMGKVRGVTVKVGGRALLTEAHANVPGGIANQVREANASGKTVVFVLANDILVGAIALGDLVREESRQAVGELAAAGIEVAMITGDSAPVADWVAKELGITTVLAQVLPEDKAAKVKELQAKNKRVAMVGDGINDAPALTQADIGIAVGAGTNVAIESAGIILMRNDPRDMVKIIKLSRLTYRKMIQNLWWAAGYNIFALPLAAGAAASWGILLNPAFSAILMSLSTVIVAINASLLRREQLGSGR